MVALVTHVILVIVDSSAPIELICLGFINKLTLAESTCYLDVRRGRGTWRCGELKHFVSRLAYGTRGQLNENNLLEPSARTMNNQHRAPAPFS